MDHQQLKMLQATRLRQMHRVKQLQLKPLINIPKELGSVTMYWVSR